jgi:hypothetical protein
VHTQLSRISARCWQEDDIGLVNIVRTAELTKLLYGITVLPSSACAASDELALITVPAPSLPTGIGWSRRALMKGSACSGTLAVILMGGTAPRGLGRAHVGRPSLDPTD